MSHIIRRLEIPDVYYVVKLYRMAMEELEGLGGHEVSKDDSAWAEAAIAIAAMTDEEANPVAFVLEQDGKVVGYEVASVHGLSSPFVPKTILRSISTYILPEYRGGTAAKELVQAAIDWGKEQGCSFAECATLKKNRAQFLLERGGFEVVGYEMRMPL